MDLFNGLNFRSCTCVIKKFFSAFGVCLKPRHIWYYNTIHVNLLVREYLVKFGTSLWCIIIHHNWLFRCITQPEGNAIAFVSIEAKVNASIEANLFYNVMKINILFK